MDNKAIANIFYETADLMKVASADPFRIRSYERAAEALEGWPQQVSDLYQDEKALLAIPGIGKGMSANIRELMQTGKLSMHEEMLQKFRPSMLELLKISGLGPKTIALIWDAFQICDVEGVAKLASEGKLRTLPRLSEKSEQKILKSIENYRQLTGRFLLNTADEIATKMAGYLAELPGVEKVTPAGSLRRGRETVGDLDLLVTGKCCETDSQRNAVIERIVNFRDPIIFTASRIPMVQIGQVRYASTNRRFQQVASVPVSVTSTDLLGQKTALFGMTRTGKSNTTKIVLKAIFALR